MIRAALIYGITLGAIIALHCAAADAAAHTLKSHQVSEDADFVYYSDTRSDGTEATRKVRKPPPPRYPQSVTIIGTNDLPVQVQYLYRELYADGRARTNVFVRTKTQRERARITLPPTPEVHPQPPRGKADALRLARERGAAAVRRPPEITRRVTMARPDRVVRSEVERGAAVRRPPEITRRVTMARPDRVVRSEVVDGQIMHTMDSGKVQFAPLRRAATARVQSAPVVVPPYTDREKKVLRRDGALIRGVPAIDPAMFP
jgi:hypothetical protein